MAVSKKNVLSTLTAQEESSFKAWEAKIDAALRTFDGGEKLIDCNASRRIVDRLIALYQGTGWTVKYEHGDQRDPGPWLRFS